jgi:hypothetical protein
MTLRSVTEHRDPALKNDLTERVLARIPSSEADADVNANDRPIDSDLEIRQQRLTDRLLSSMAASHTVILSETHTTSLDDSDAPRIPSLAAEREPPNDPSEPTSKLAVTPAAARTVREDPNVASPDVEKDPPRRDAPRTEVSNPI